MIVHLIVILVIVFTLIIFFYGRSRISESFSTSNSKLNIIQTWKNYQIPPKYKNLVSGVKKLNPNCNYILFNDNDIEHFIKKKFPQYLSTFYKFPYTIQKIDFFRYLAIYYYGGVYLDLDIKLHQSVQNLSNTSKCVFPLEFKRSSDRILHQQGFQGLIGNYAFYAPKSHPFVKKIIDNIVSKRIPIKMSECSDYRQYVYYTTGPVMVTQSYLDYTSKHEIDIIQPQPFQKSSFGGYGKHVQMGTWKL